MSGNEKPLIWKTVRFGTRVRNVNTYRLTTRGTITKICMAGPGPDWSFQVRYADGTYGSGYKNPGDFVLED